MGNQVATLGDSNVSRSSNLRNKVKHRVKSPGTFRHVGSPSSSVPIHESTPPKRKRQSRSHSEGVTSDCSTAISTTDFPHVPRHLEKRRETMGPLVPSESTPEEDDGGTRLEKHGTPTRPHDAEQLRRIRQAEQILVEIAKEYAAKRAAGLVPTKPVPARTLLWEEMERRAQRLRLGIGRRGTCVYGRDSDNGACGCSTYKKKKDMENGRENTGGVCECCNHGASWHRLTGGTTAAPTSSLGAVPLRSRSRLGSRTYSHKTSSAPHGTSEDSLYSLGSDNYDQVEDEYSDDESSDDDAIANEVARPYSMMDDPTPPLIHRHAPSEADALDRNSLFANGDSFGLPPRLSSTSRHLDKLLSAIAKYRGMGFSEAEIEDKIRDDFPPTERHDRAQRRTTRASQ
ncbi:hypothetical protein PsorP6_013264 [Peronosclerospora sorghi]|uniref:Uncharacterized protein n=1 Tax=Peronosclerospora sorghi TaxID=230839 RepID=A0ACC0WEV0_9STRA|nr:hypothetical protein PsorP6_013264 [Peronosclerospora sorghi]